MSNPNINIHLLNLVKQYKSDVETRISGLQDEMKGYWLQYESDLIDGCKEQISHWQITLLQINEVLKECEK